MTRPTRPARAMRTALAILAAAAVAGCSTETPVAPDGLGSPQFARGGGSAPAPSVNAANPNNLPRGSTSMMLEVIGSGFTAESSVGFELDGTTTRDITTTSVTFVDETRLIATVDVSIDALEVSYDIAVSNGPKKKGVGIDLLQVTEAAGAYPVVEGQPLPGLVVVEGETLSLYDAVGSWLTGTDAECGFVYDLTTGTRTCVDIPGAEPTQTYVKAVNASGLIAVSAFDVALARSRPFVIDWANAPSATTLLETPAGWDAARLSGRTRLNAQGLVVGQAYRDYLQEGRGKNKSWTVREYAAVLWNPDGTIRSVSAAVPELVIWGLSDVQPDGSVYVGTHVGIWDGQAGSVPSGPAVDWISPDAVGYAMGDNAILSYVGPTWQPGPSLSLNTLNLSSVDGDRNGNLLVRGTLSGDGGLLSLLCVARDGSGVSDLAQLDGYASAHAYTGANGFVYGRSQSDGNAYGATFWDLSTASGGCGTGS